MARLHCWIKGQVQGVFFRDTTRQEAEKLGLSGWVRNLPDGSVEAVFEGERSSCEKALAYAWRGPRSARVDQVEARWEDEEEGLTGFRIRN